MALTNFIPRQTLVTADWLNSVDILKETIGTEVGSDLVGYDPNVIYEPGSIGYAIQQGIIAGNFVGTWNADTNSPLLTSGVGSADSYYIVSTAGTTTLDGISSWAAGDQVRFNGTVWQKVPYAGASAASAVSFDPYEGITATDVQAALEELEDEKAPIAAPTFTDTVGGTAVLRVTAAGNVAVSPSIPSGLYGKFAVLGTGVQSTYVQSTDGGVILQNKANNATSGDIGTVSNHPLNFKVNDVNQFKLNTNTFQSDWSNTAFTSRMSFQTSTANSNTNIQVVPNGTATTAGYVALNNSTPADCAFSQFSITSTKARWVSSAIGSGTQLPVEIVVGGTPRIEIAVNGETTIEKLMQPALPVAPPYLQTISQIMQGERVSIMRFLVNGQDSGAQTLIDDFRTGLVSTDFAVQFQEALDAAELNAYELYIPPVWQYYKIGTRLLMQYPMKISGAGTHPYRSEVGTRDRGSWLYFNHMDVGIEFSGNDEFQLKSGVVFEGLGTIRNQLEPTTPGWTPIANDYDFKFGQVDVRMEDILLLNPTKGIYHAPGNAGRMRLFDVRGQPFDVGIQMDDCFDSHRLENIHWWPYWSNLSAINTYTKANRKGIYLWHVDNPYISNYFDIFSAYSLFFTDGVDGQPTSRALINNFGFDQVGLQAVYVEAGSDDTTAQFTNGYALGEGAFNAVAVYANNCKLAFTNFRATNFKQQAIIASGTGNKIQLGQTNIELWNLDNGGYTALAATGTSQITVEDEVLLSDGNGADLANDGLLIKSQMWHAFAPTLSAVTGTLGVNAYTGSYRHHKGLIHFTVTLTITANGTGSVALQFALPTAAKFGAQFSVLGKETNVTGRAVAGVAVGSAVVFTYADTNGYPGADGTQFILSGFYEPAI